MLEDTRVAVAHVVEALPEVVGWHEDHLLPFALGLHARSALPAHAGRLLRDGRRRYRLRARTRPTVGTRSSWTSTTRRGTTCTPATRRSTSRPGSGGSPDSLHPGGVFGLWSDDPPDGDFMVVMDSVFDTCVAHVVTFPNPYTDGESACTVYVAGVGELTCDAGRDYDGRSRTTSAAALSSRSPRYLGWRSLPSVVHSENPTCATSSGSTQCASAFAHAVGERGRVPFDPVEGPPQGHERVRVVPGADLARVPQLAAFVVAEEERAEPDPAALRLGEPADHQLLLGLALELEPVGTAPADVRRRRALGDQALPTVRARVRVVGLARPVAVRAEAQRVAEVDRGAQDRLARAQIQRADVVAVAPDHVEEVVRDLHSLGPLACLGRGTHAEPLLQPREAGAAAFEGDHLTVDDEIAVRPRRERVDELRVGVVEAQVVA